MKNLQRISFFIIGLFISLLAKAEDPHKQPKDKDEPSVNVHLSNTLTTSPLEVERTQRLLTKQVKSSLEQALKKLGNSLDLSEASQGETVWTQPYCPPETISDQDSARALFTRLDKDNKWIANANPNIVANLPQGYEYSSGNTKVQLGLLRIAVNSQYAEITAFARILVQTPNSPEGKPQELFFGANNLKMNYSGGFIGDANFVLLGDVIIPMEKMAIKLKGGLDRKTSITRNLTYITFDCNGFREMSLSADVLFPEDMLMALGPDGKAKEGPVVASFTAIASSFDDLMVDLTIPPFAVKGFSQFGFQINKAILDLSDIRNASGTSFPQGYLARNTPQGEENVWRGVYIHEFKIWLPEEFKTKNSTERYSISAKDLIVDNKGVTVNVEINAPIYTLDDGRAGNWNMSLEKFAFTFIENKLVGGGFGGRIMLPLSKNQDQALGYQALIQPGGNYQLIVSAPKAGLSFDVWQAKATLEPNSFISLTVKNNEFLPKAVLHGKLDIDAKTNPTSDKKLATFEGVVFKGLTLQTEAPYLSADYLGYQGDISVAGFPLSITELGLTSTNTTSNLYFGARINLMKDVFSGGTRIVVKGKIQDGTWVSDGVQVGAISLKGTIGTFSMNGSVILYENDPIYGDGFGGSIHLGIKTTAKDSLDKIGVDAEAKFGAKSEKFRYWYVMAKATFPEIGFIPPLAINALGGGAFYQMKPAITTNPLATTRVQYIPDSTISLGFKAVVGLKTAGSNAFVGQAGFDMVFNKNGGLNSLGFFGEGELSASAAFNVGNFDIGDRFEALVEKTNITSNSLVKTLSQSDLVAKSDTEFPSKLKADGKIKFNFGMLFDFQNHTMHGEADVYMNLGGVFTGTGPNYRAGHLVMHFDPQIWYIHAGTPSERIGVRIGYGGFSVKTQAYFMVGHNIPAIPDPPAFMINIIGKNRIDAIKATRQAETNNLQTGKGFAFGAFVIASTGDQQIAIFYYNFTAGAGFDVMLRDNYPCGNNRQRGWYARGQAYAYVSGDVGIKVRTFWKTYRCSIFSGAAGVLLEAGLPNPSWFEGNVSGRYSVLGGLARGDFNVKLSIGDVCR
jgi:hypothetical protein